MRLFVLANPGPVAVEIEGFEKGFGGVSSSAINMSSSPAA